jgi:hypothetical protein
MMPAQIHLFVCTLFSYKVETLEADTFVLCRLAHDTEEAKSGLDEKNLEIHPSPEWTGHYVSAAQCGDELVKLAAMEISLTTPTPSELQNPLGIVEEKVDFAMTATPLSASPETGPGGHFGPGGQPVLDEKGVPVLAFPTNKKLW